MKRATSFLSSHGLTVQESDSQGRYVVATRKFAAGQTVHPWSLPYCEAVRKGCLQNCCASCFKGTKKLLVCSKCKYARYCSKDCQKRDWASGHKHLCSNISQILPNKPTESLIMLSKILMRLKFEKAGVPGPDHYTFEDVDILQSHRKKAKESDVEMYTRMSAMVVHLVGQPLITELNMNTTTMIDFFCKFRSNNFNIYDEQMNTVGIGLFPVLSLINHSCNPNCVPIFDGKKVKLVGLRPIEPGDEITISYTEIAASTEDRQHELEEHFFFTCHCTKCQDKDEDHALTALQPGVNKEEAEKAQLKMTHILEEIRHIESEGGDTESM